MADDSKVIVGIGTVGHPGEDAEKAAKKAANAKQQPARLWIADEFDGCTYLHNVDGLGTARRLEAGDEIPAGFEDEVKSHIPTTDEQPRSSRLREFDASLGQGDRDTSFDPRDHTVAEVNEYLRSHPREVQRVLDLERTGAARISILRRD